MYGRQARPYLAFNLYTPYYCEENIWHLCQESRFAPMRAHVVFISNLRRQCYFWYQRAARNADEPICWDYHVILLAKDTSWKIWDLDTTLAFPSDALAYLNRTFMHVGKTTPEWDPLFRLVDARQFAAEFASDRSHMIDADGNWMQPPPHWEPIGNGRPNNLQSFIDMDSTAFGTALDINALRVLLL